MHIVMTGVSRIRASGIQGTRLAGIVGKVGVMFLCLKDLLVYVL